MKYRVGISVLLVAGFLSAGLAPAAAKDYSGLYDDATLREWAGRYRPGIMSNLRDVLIPNLSPEERRGLSRLKIDIPLRSEFDDVGPLDFYAKLDGTVVLPAMSLKFFDELSIAYAWLFINGYSPETVLEYVGLLKYGDERKLGGWPRPFAALRIPANALDNADVDSLSQKIFKSAIIFILLHEMGHVLYRHPGYGPNVARADARGNEAQADRFALEVMRRLPAQPTGAFLFFQTMSYFAPNRGDYRTEAAFQKALDQATHPLTPNRMRDIAKLLRERKVDFAREYRSRDAGLRAVETVAREISGIADTLSDPDLQRLIAQTSRQATLVTLAPRKHGEKIGRTPDRQAPAAGGYSGTYDGAIVLNGERFPMRMQLQRNGSRVVGIYTYGAGFGQIDGEVQDGKLYYRWQFGTATGRGTITDRNGQVSGTWGNGSSATDGGDWSARKID